MHAAVRRAAVIAACALLVAATSSCLLPDNKPRISIEFGGVPELEGSEVLIDGKVVGKLEKTGQATRIAFPVEKGEHEVTIKSTQFACQPAKVRLELPAQKLHMLAQIGDGFAPDGTMRPTVQLTFF